MAIEQYTESLTLGEMKCVLGDNGTKATKDADTKMQKNRNLEV